MKYKIWNPCDVTEAGAHTFEGACLSEAVEKYLDRHWRDENAIDLRARDERGQEYEVDVEVEIRPVFDVSVRRIDP